MSSIKVIIYFIIGLSFLIEGGNWFVDGATGLARRFKIPELLIGATVVSIGTTLPEVMVSATSAVAGHGEIAYGNAIGSIICNTALIAALTVTIRPSTVDRGSLRMPVWFFFAAAAVYLFVAYIVGTYTRVVGLILLALFAVYMVLSVKQAMKDEELQEFLSQGSNAHELQAEQLERVFEPLWKSLLSLVAGAVLIAAGADLLVDNGIILARMFGVPESVIALTFVALGTSLPELVTAITSLVKGHGLLSLGNIIGANMFNLVLVSGISIALNPFDLPAEKTLAGMNSSLLVDVPVMMLVMLLLTVPAMLKGRLYRSQGIILLLIYAGFCAYQFASPF